MMIPYDYIVEELRQRFGVGNNPDEEFSYPELCAYLGGIFDDYELDEDLTICGEHGCDGCLYQHCNDIELCKAVAERNKNND